MSAIGAGQPAEVRAAEVRVAPLVLATMASQALLVVLAPTIVAIAEEFGTSVGAAGQARSITAAVATAVALAIIPRADAVGVRPLLAGGSVLGIAGCAAVAAAPSLPVFLSAHVLIGLGFAALLSGGFAGVAAFPADRRAWAIGHVAAANGLAWIVANPLVGVTTEALSWRWAQAVPAAIALGALVAARSAAPVPAAGVALPLRSLTAPGSTRRWITAELIAFSAWSALLTFSGAFFIERLAAGEALTGWLLAAGAVAFYVASTRSGALVARLPRRRLVAGSALALAALAAALYGLADSIGAGVGLFCLIGIAAGIRTPAASGLGLDQLPGHPAAMMAARTAATQAGYLVGAVAGGALIAGAGYAAFGIALAAGMVVSAALILRVEEAPG